MSSNKLKDIFNQQRARQESIEQEDQEGSELKDSEKLLQIVGFIVGSEEFAVPILSIQEIVKPIEYTRVPSTPEYVLGVFNLRGNVFPLIDLRLKFGLPPVKQSSDTRFIVIKNQDEVAGFVIDKLTEAVRIKESDIDPTPSQEDSSLIYGIGKQANRLITILKVEHLLKRSF